MARATTTDVPTAAPTTSSHPNSEIAQRVASRFVAVDDGGEYERRLQKEMEKHSRGAGKVLEVDMVDASHWTVVFSTEYAALKAHYKYIGTPRITLGKSSNPSGWLISTK